MRIPRSWVDRWNDWRHERRIAKAFRTVQDLQSIGASANHVRKAVNEFSELVMLRSPEQVARMEKARGLR